MLDVDIVDLFSPYCCPNVRLHNMVHVLFWHIKSRSKITIDIYDYLLKKLRKHLGVKYHCSRILIQVVMEKWPELHHTSSASADVIQ